MRLVSGEPRLVFELTVNHNVDIVSKLVVLAVASNLEPARMWNCGENRKARDYLIDMDLVLGSEEDDVTNNV
ncbi:hypothetical protein GGD63_007206 [Bradyrhizobium sp. cir1]|nr:hypothetical protein [Bradyrhizobium sp. cir1]